MGSKRKRSRQKAARPAEAHINEAVPPISEDDLAFERIRACLGMSLVSDMFGYHRACSFKDCRAAGRCMAWTMSDKPCPVPLDNVMVLIFGGMMLFHDAFCYEILGHRKEHDGSDAEGGGADRRG